MKVLILANGDAPGPAFLQALTARHDLLIAVDGGVGAAMASGVIPQIVCGDFDSADMAAARTVFPSAEYVPLPDQNLTDLEKTVQLARMRGAAQITITGAWGGRIDHALAGIVVLMRYGGEIALQIAEDGFDLLVASGKFALAASPGDTVSLLALGADVRVTIANVQWPLTDELLAIGTRGISNVALGETVSGSVRGGLLVVCRLTQATNSR